MLRVKTSYHSTPVRNTSHIPLEGLRRATELRASHKKPENCGEIDSERTLGSWCREDPLIHGEGNKQGHWAHQGTVLVFPLHSTSPQCLWRNRALGIASSKTQNRPRRTIAFFTVSLLELITPQRVTVQGHLSHVRCSKPDLAHAPPPSHSLGRTGNISRLKRRLE